LEKGATDHFACFVGDLFDLIIEGASTTWDGCIIEVRIVCL
jgi:hypothetical protein